MKKYIVFVLLISFWVACKLKISNQNLSMDNYYAYNKSDSLLIDIVSYIDKLPENVSDSSRFDKSNQAHFVEGFKTRFKFVNYYVDKDSVNYYQTIQKVPSLLNRKRLVAGKFKIKNNSITDFEQSFITNKLNENKIESIKDSLFVQLIENKKIDSTYVEWPNKWVKYNKSKNRWE